jgi:hypothetical protein
MTNEIDRFDLEQCIMKCWTVVDDIQELREFINVQDANLGTVDSILLGMELMYQNKFNRLFDQFSTLIKQKKII